MGRWAQAERRGGATDDAGYPRVNSASLIADPTLIAQWNASENATQWEVQVWDVDFPDTTLQSANVRGVLRIWVTEWTPDVDHVYQMRVRAWIGARACAWGPIAEYVAV